MLVNQLLGPADIAGVPGVAELSVMLNVELVPPLLVGDSMPRPYRTVRALVLTRQFPLDQPLELTMLAERTELEPANVVYALMKLAGENLVGRTSDDVGELVALLGELVGQVLLSFGQNVDAECAGSRPPTAFRSTCRCPYRPQAQFATLRRSDRSPMSDQPPR